MKQNDINNCNISKMCGACNCGETPYEEQLKIKTRTCQRTVR